MTTVQQPDGRLWVGSPHSLAWPRTTQEPNVPGQGAGSPSQYSVGPGARGESMFNQPAFVIEAGMPAVHSQPDIPRELYERSGSAMPTFFPQGNRAAETVHAAQGNHTMPYFLLVPPDRFNALANFGGGNRRGPHDVRNTPKYGQRPSRRKVFGIPVGS